MPSQALVQIIADTSRFDDNLRAELTAIIERVEAGLPPITVQVRIDDRAARHQLRNFTNTRPDDVSVRVNVDTDMPLKNVSTLITKMALIAPTIVQAGVASVGALAGIGAAFGAAAVAGGAFLAAVKPQLQDVTDVTKLYEDAQKAAAEGAEDAAEKQKLYEKALKDLSPATRDTAKSFLGLKKDFKDWSDSLSGSTMPLFTRGIELLRDILPKLSPLVRAVSGQLGEFMTTLETGVKGGGLDKFVKVVKDMVNTTIPALVRSFGNIGAGILGIIQAFKPLSDGFSGSFEEMTQSFQEWGEGLKNNTAFQEFISQFTGDGAEISTTLSNLANIVTNLLVALAPFSGVLLSIVSAFTNLLAIIPPPVITALAVAFTTWAIAIRVYTAVVVTVTAVTRAWAIAQGILTAVMFLGLGPILLLVAGITALIAVVVLIALKTTWFQTIWSTTWNGIKTATLATIGGLQVAMSATWGAIKTGVSEALNGIKIAWNSAWGGIKLATTTTINGIKTTLVTVAGGIKTALSTTWNGIKTTASTSWNGIKTTITTSFKGVLTGIQGTIKLIVTAVKGVKTSIVSFFSGASGWLKESGKAVIRGFISGIKSMAGAAKDAVSGIVSGVRGLFPNSPAKEGPFSGKGYTPYSGQALMLDFLKGMESVQPTLKSGVGSILDGLQGEFAGAPSMTQMRGSSPFGTQTDRPLNIDRSMAPTILVTIGNQAVDQYVQTRIDRNNADRNRAIAQGRRL